MSPTFAQLGVPDHICDALARRDITEPFEIQAATIADALAGRDVCGRAPTGSGKTLAFGIPLVASVASGTSRRPRALILAPTRELADQITQELRTFAGKTRIAVVYGGVGYGPQLKALNSGVDILVACPGRLEDLIEQGAVRLDDVDKVVVDEADRMADMGFMPAVRRLLDQVATNRQTVLFSATLDGDIAKLTRDYQNDPARHEVGEETPDVTLADHVFWNVQREKRTDVTADAVNAVWPAIIFCRTRHGSDRLARQLGQRDIKAAAIHGGRSQRQRTRALKDFADGRVHALVATDVAARGIHVDGVASVIHYDPSEDHKTYIHRSGRTARAGEGGVVLSLVQPDQVRDLQRTQRKIGLDVPFIAPDAGALRDLSNAPERTLAPPSPDGNRRDRDDDDRPRRKRRGGASSRSRHGGGDQKRQSRRDDRSERSDGDRGRSANGRSAKPARQQRSDSDGNGSDGERAGGARSGGNKTAAHKSGPDKSGPPSKKRSGPKRGSQGGAKRGPQGASTSKAPNRKERRAHLQAGGSAATRG